MPQDILFENRAINVAGKEMLVGIVYYTPETTGQTTAEGIHRTHQKLADAFLADPISAEQKSACVISDSSALAHLLTREFWENWYKTADQQMFQTQQELFRLFKRPVFMIYVMPGLDADYFSKQLMQTNAQAVVPIYVDSLDAALETAAESLRLAHRL